MSSRLRLIAFAAIAVGLIVRTLPLVFQPDGPLSTCDGRASWVMAQNMASGRGLYIDDPYLLTVCSGQIDLGPSHHYAPALPLIESLFVSVLGPNPLALVLPLLVISWLAVAVVWWTTRDLFGRDAALLAAAAVSLEWTGVIYGTLLGYSENLVLIAFALALWAILRGLRDDRFWLLAGLAAGLGYLSKASMGWFFLIAGLGGLAYRLLFRGWRVLANRWYWAAIAIFAVPVVLWSYRNLSLFWDGTPLGLIDAWQTSAHNARAVGQAVAQPGQLLVGMLGKLPVLAAVLLLPFVPLAGRLAAALRRWREEEAFGLWLTVGLIFGLGVFFAAAFWIDENTSLLWTDPARYISPAQVPLLWLILRERRPQSTRRWGLSLLILAAMVPAVPLLSLRGAPFGP